MFSVTSVSGGKTSAMMSLLYPADNLQWWLDVESKTGKSFGDRKLKDILSQPLLNVFDTPDCHCSD